MKTSGGRRVIASHRPNINSLQFNIRNLNITKIRTEFHYETFFICDAFIMKRKVWESSLKTLKDSQNVESLKHSSKQSRLNGETF